MATPSQGAWAGQRLPMPSQRRLLGGEGQESPSVPALSSHSGRWKGLSLSLHTNSCPLNPPVKHAPTQSPSMAPTTHQAKPFNLTDDTGHCY